MKKVRIIFPSILAMAILAGALAFKAKKIQGFCVYKASTSTTIDEDEREVTITICPKIGQYTQTPYPFGVKFSSIFIDHTLCAVAPLFTNISKCTLTLTVTIE